MDFSFVLRTAAVDFNKLKDFGFVEKNGKFLFTKPLSGEFEGFYAEFVLCRDSFSAQVYETETKEKYALLDVPRAKGSFVGGLRQLLSEIVDGIRESCFPSADLKDRYLSFLEQRFQVQPDFPWEDTPDYGVFRCKNSKWFALVMKIKFKQLGLLSEEPVWVVNLKADPEKIPQITDRKSVFPAYHMNKKYWITVILNSVTDFDFLCQLTEESYGLVNK